MSQNTVTTELRGKMLMDEPLAKHTSWRVGGVAQKMYFPADREDLVEFINKLPANEPVFWLGLGSNLLVRDGGIAGTVINSKGRLKVMRLNDDKTVYVEAGVPCAHVARFCGEQGLVGAEFLAGIPGTMGGALKMNAGAFGGETWEIVSNVDVIDKQGKEQQLPAKNFAVSYRHIEGLKTDQWFLATTLNLQTGDTKASQKKIKELLEKRGQTQPTKQPSCGSVFKNPEGDFAARLIESSNLKGYKIGGACVSEKHANFIVNTGSATAADIESLIHYVQAQVKEQQGVLLETEVCMVGESL